MRIGIYAGGMPFDGTTISEGKSLGGSETAAYYMAIELAKLGHEVVCFVDSPTGNCSFTDDVSYQWVGTRTQQYPHGDRFHQMMETPWDAVIMQRHPQAFIRPYNSKLNIWWLHDLAMIRNAPAVHQQLVYIDKIFTVSEWHKDQVTKTYDINSEYVEAVKNGVDYEMFEGINEDRIPNSLLYMARPERGLENLIRVDGIMDKLPECHLYVCGYDNTTSDMAQYYDVLKKRCNEMPNVTNLGALGKRELYEWLNRVKLYVYPTTFEDTSCIAVLEANAAGTPVIGSKISAVPETSEGGGTILLDLKDGQVDQRKFVRTIKQVLKTPSKWDNLHTAALSKSQSWKEQAIEWDFILRRELANKCINPTRLVKHFERVSDIQAIIEMSPSIKDIAKILPDFETNYGFFLNDTFAEHYKSYYEYEKNRGVNYGPEDISNTPRFQSILAQLVSLLGLKKGDRLDSVSKTIMDYGCAHGHYTVTLAKIFPNCKFVGVDIAQTNIDKAIAWAKDEKLENITFICDSYETLRSNEHYIQIQDTEIVDFDAVIAAEVIEHVAKPLDLLNELHHFVSSDGYMLVSTPYGPWEAQGYKEHKGWRAHLHHFERADFHDILSNHPNSKVLALPGGNGLGHFIVVYQPHLGGDLNELDYSRKICTQSPQETLSVCIIAKDAEFTLGKTLQSIADIADEIIVGIDPATTDQTHALATKLGAVSFYLDKPVLESGFDSARNATIDKATMDWILWVDSDETIEQPEVLPQFLRNNQFTGYAIAQHHVAFEPAGLLRTDFPCRIFRNHKGIRFFGVVHEHPEREMNKGVGKIFVVPGVGILHTGYSTEKIRRKRFERNFPLMVRDRNKYPNRELADFLWLRDIAHTVRYALERNGHSITQEIHTNCTVIVEEWRKLVIAGKLRFAAEGLQYYSEAVRLLTMNGGINYGVSLGAKRSPDGSFSLPASPLKGTFISTDDIELFTKMLVSDTTKGLNERYW